MKAATPLRSARRARPSYVAVPPLTRPDDGAEGADVLAELPGSTGVLLFQALRDVMLWLETPAGSRRGLFPYGAGAQRRDEVAAAMPDQELWAPLLTLTHLLDAPEAAEAARVVYACRAVGRWAERRKAPATRLAFVQAAALALQGEAKLALETAKLARDLARYAQAESWFRCTITLARRRDWETYAWGFMGLGVLYIRTGNFPAAQTVIGRALRTGTKRRMRKVQGAGHHHLFNLMADAGKMGDAYEHARSALQAYGSDNPRVVELGHDLGRFWMLQGCHARAAAVFEALAPRMSTAPLRLLATANLAHAAAGAGHRARYEAARERALTLAEASPDGARVSEALWILSAADADMREWDRAAELARRSLALATARGESESAVQAERQLERARQRHAAETPTKLPETVRNARSADRLARDLVRSLEPVGAAA